jgi:uncharacterized membrane protein YhaH (DUF805 family)
MKYYLEVLKKYADFNGRARRKEYWMFFLLNMIISYSLMFIDVYFETLFINSIYSLVVLIPSIAVGVRRMHDAGKSGWYLLIPIYNLVLACTEGDFGQNKYGPDPKNIINEIEEIGVE